jgi:hypothetical protein
MPTSFICEHTAEFFLVPTLARLLSNEETDVVPLYFWKSREGSAISKRCGRDAPLRLVAMFARRPKVDDPDDRRILVKLNDVIFERAYQLARLRVPTFAGVPRVSSITNLRRTGPCSWFCLHSKGSSVKDVEFYLNVESGRCETALPSTVEGPLEDERIVRLAYDEAAPMSWEDAIEAMRGESGSPERDERRVYRWWGETYKPVYLILIAKSSTF